jgi:drug/metabolite transporter (DMT)-like permease
MDAVGATKVSMVSYLVAPFGVVYGAAILSEPIAPNAVAGLIVIIVGILIAGGTWRSLIPQARRA